ncbi:hypothetical protein M758_3G253300 [Ceratodon purpureus]|nr:hypothetical protein M758_3G253300 [Ceratodon purpureus]
MSRLTRLASTKIHISDMDLFAEVDEDPSSDDPQGYNVLVPSSLPHVPNQEEKYWNVDKQTNYNTKNNRAFPNNENSSTIPRSSEYLKAAGLIDQNRPTVFHQGHNRSSASHLGYSPSKPQVPSFTMPPQPLRPSLEDNLRPARYSTVDHYSRLTGGPIFHGNNANETKQDDDNDIEDQNDNASKELANAKNTYSEFNNPEPYRNEELDAYNSSIQSNFQGLQKPFKLQPPYTKDYNHIEENESNTNKRPEVSRESFEQTLENDQPMYRRVSASGHVSSTLQPSTSSLPSHESPFADYTKRGLRENPKLSINKGYIDKTLVKNDEDASTDRNFPLKDNKPPKPTTQSSKPLELTKVGVIAKLKQGELRRSSSGHISKEIISDTDNILPHESSFADYSRHGIQEQPTQPETKISPFVQSTSNPPHLKGTNPLVDSKAMQSPLAPTYFNSTSSKRSPWASETGDPSHSIVQVPETNVPPFENNIKSLVEAKPNDIAHTSSAGESSVVTNIPQTFGTTSRVSLYSNNDIPSYTQILGVVPSRRNSKNQDVSEFPKAS